jgi:hypothetical protein
MEAVDPDSGPSTAIVAPQILLSNHVKTLKLPTFAREYEKVAKKSAQDRADYPRFLLRLCELERIDRERRNVERRIRGTIAIFLRRLNESRGTSERFGSSRARSADFF